MDAGVLAEGAAVADSMAHPGSDAYPGRSPAEVVAKAGWRLRVVGRFLGFWLTNSRVMEMLCC